MYKRQVTIPVVLIEGLPLKPVASPVTLPVTLPVTSPTKLGAVTELVTLAIPAMVIVEPPPTGLILLTFSILILFDYL